MVGGFSVLFSFFEKGQSVYEIAHEQYEAKCDDEDFQGGKTK
jgi:hypothetical protein